MNKWYEAAQKVRVLYQKGAQFLTNLEALQVKGIYPTWEECVELGSIDTDGRAGYKFIYNEDLYSCVNGNPTFQADWIPGQGTESLYTRIDEEHEGTLEDPIPYNGNMELFEGLYYSQNDIVYHCIRNTETPVYHALADLVGLYVEVVQ